MTNVDKTRKIPLEMTREVYNTLAGAKDYSYGAIKIGARMTHGILVDATEEEYQNYVRSLNNEEKQIERQRKCLVPSEKTGKLIRCTRSCDGCEHFKNGASLSLEQLHEDSGHECVSTDSGIEKILTKQLFEQLLDVLQSEDRELAYIFSEMYYGRGQRDIERELDLPHSSMTDKVTLLRSILKQLVTREDILG